jgi:hypothetical protein
MRRSSRPALVSAGILVGWSCAPASSDTAAPAAAPSLPETWCASIEAALGEMPGAREFRCLSVPNFLVTGFYGGPDNPERSDFVNGCFAGEHDAGERLRMSVRPVGDLRFTHHLARRVSGSGRLDLGFLGPWAPRLALTGAASEEVSVTVELADAEIRTLSSVAEILGQAFRAADPEGSPGAHGALQACLENLCDGSRESLVYTTKVIAAVPVIRVRLASREHMAPRVEVGSVAGFEVAQTEEHARAFELRAHAKLNVAALLEEAAPAFERARTCEALRRAEARRTVVSGFRQLGARVLAGRAAEDGEASGAALRAGVTTQPDAFSEHEQRDLLLGLEVLEASARELSASRPVPTLCETRHLVERLLSGNGNDNQLHDLVLDVAQPLHERLTTLANKHALPCAEPAFYRDADGDGFGDPSQMVRARAAPKGYVANSLDCDDRSADARPGQNRYFDRPRADGSFDYDCDGRASPQAEVVAGGCKVITRFGVPIRCWAEPGWHDRPPACGAQGRWFATCVEGMFSCDPGPMETKRQACR